METNTEIDLAAVRALNPKYDAACKRLFQHPEIIAPILKAVVPEYKDCTMAKVIACIDASSISDDPVDDASALAGLPTEMSSVSEKLIRYDTRFRAVNPKLSTENLRFFLHIDLEVQNDYRPGYPITKRGVYYTARDISAQLGTLTETTDYNALEKVYSIWICNDNIPADLQNTVTSYRLTKYDEIGTSQEDEKDYDLMSVILIRRGNDDGTQEIFDYLTGVFTSSLEKLGRYVDMDSNDEIRKEVTGMSGLGLSIAEKNYQKGIDYGMMQGIEQGIEQGISQNMAATARAMLRDNLPIDMICKYSGLSKTQVQELAAEMKP